MCAVVWMQAFPIGNGLCRFIYLSYVGLEYSCRGLSCRYGRRSKGRENQTDWYRKLFAWQLAEANAIAKENGWPEFVSVQNHYNLIMREEEREMNVYAAERNIALTPYSALAAGRLSKRPGEISKRLEQDAYAKLKYDATSDKDAKVIARVCEIADVHGVSMTEVSLAWLLTKVSSPVVGATKISHVEGSAKAVELKLSDDEINSLEELYEPHFLSGVMAQNTPAARNIEQVWIKNGKYRK